MIAPPYCGSFASAGGLSLCGRVRDLKIRTTVRQEILVDRKGADRVPFDRRRRGVILADVDPRGACPGPLRLPPNFLPRGSRILLPLLLLGRNLPGAIDGAFARSTGRRAFRRVVGRACGSGAALPRPERHSSEIQKPALASRRLQLLQPQVMAAFATALVVSAVFSLLAALFVRTFRLARKDFRLLLLVLFSFSLLGFVTGQIMGQSREPAVMGVLPAVLTLLGGIAIYLVGAKGLQTQALVAAMVSCFALALLTGVHFGGRLRVDFETQNPAY